MSTKTIAVDSRVYARLAAAKQESESFSKTIDRILGEVGGRTTGDDVLSRLRDFPALSETDAEQMLDRVAESRAHEEWDRHDLS
jgi:predicted CopG family antitoxin